MLDYQDRLHSNSKACTCCEGLDQRTLTQYADTESGSVLRSKQGKLAGEGVREYNQAVARGTLEGIIKLEAVSSGS